MSEAIDIFYSYSYSHKDKTLRDRLDTHLAMLKHEGLINQWQDKFISPSRESIINYTSQFLMEA